MTSADPPPGETSEDIRFALLPLGQTSSQDAAVVGSKAATLSRLREAFPDRVPPGWALPVAQAAALLQTGDPAAEQQALKSLRATVERVVGAEASVSYAVRSSGLDEDSGEHSFAGQYLTVLGVSGADAVANAVCTCVRSCSAPHIDAYRKRAGQPDIGAPAVLIHEMVPAERAGVAFTVNPVSGASETVVDAGYGLGDLVVGGEITPDELAVDDRGNVLREKLGSKRRMSLLTADGVKQIAVPRALQQRMSLSPPQLSAIVETANLCKAILGYQADVEWAIADDRVFVLQARPVTAAAGKRSTP
jgi:pyruvate,water dikinase